jgi:hypothetical protein
VLEVHPPFTEGLLEKNEVSVIMDLDLVKGI